MEPLNILVVEDNRADLLLLSSLLNHEGHHVMMATSGLEAFQIFRTEKVDIVLMDIVMQGVDGVETARRIRRINDVIPIIFLSGMSQDTVIEDALTLGTDFISKPLRQQQLRQKLNAHFRTVMAYREIARQKKEVEELHERLLEENRMAAHVLSRMFDRMLPSSDVVQYTIMPSGLFSGDFVLAGRTPSGRMNVLLADAIGHGLPAAFSLMPIFPIFETMTKKDFPLSEILRTINNTIKNIMPVGRFIAGTGLSIDFSNGNCEVWIGGNPSVHLVSNGQVKTFKSQYMSLGLNDDVPEEFICEQIELATHDRLVLFSDGLMDVWDEFIAPQQGSMEAFMAQCAPERLFDEVVALAEQHPRHDDTSLVVIRF